MGQSLISPLEWWGRKLGEDGVEAVFLFSWLCGYGLLGLLLLVSDVSGDGYPTDAGHRRLSLGGFPLDHLMLFGGEWNVQDARILLRHGNPPVFDHSLYLSMTAGSDGGARNFFSRMFCPWSCLSRNAPAAEREHACPPRGSALICSPTQMTHSGRRGSSTWSEEEDRGGRCGMAMTSASACSCPQPRTMADLPEAQPIHP